MGTTFISSVSPLLRAAASLVIVGAMGVFAATGDSAIIADLENGTNENNFQAYWYLYDDCNDGGTSSIVNAADINSTICGDGKYEFLPTAGEGNSLGTPGYAAKVVYEFGANEPSCGAGCTYGQMVGIGTQLAKEGSVYDLTGATTITYWAKASAAMTVRVEVCQTSVLNFAYHYTTHEISTSWEQHTIILQEGLGVDQPGWNTEPVDFDLSKIEKLQWQMSADEGCPTSGTVWIDDIVVHGIEWVSPDLIDAGQMRTAGSASSIDGEMLSDMNERPYNQNALGYYWYCYNDAEGRSVSIPGEEYSEIIAGAAIDSVEPTKPVIVIDGNGYDNTNGAYIEFQLGPTYTENGQTIMPFVGIGTRLSDNLGTMFFDADAAGATGLYFDYKTTGDINMIRLEVKADQAFPNAGIVHSILLPKTDGQWQGVLVPWTALKLPDWEEVNQLPPSMRALKTSALEQIQWAYQGKAGETGSMAVDNVLLAGATIGVQNGTVAFARQSMRVRLNEGMLVVDGTRAGTTVQLLDLFGRVHRRACATGSAASVRTADLSAGRYILSVSGSTGDVLRAPVTLSR
ncbi:MAG: hypothetical protein GF331_18795 [Chitinivibrionales bacterium]|nr:hypothetical protein [Chitinivibrionales bacterium]